MVWDRGQHLLSRDMSIQDATTNDFVVCCFSFNWVYTIYEVLSHTGPTAWLCQHDDDNDVPMTLSLTLSIFAQLSPSQGGLPWPPYESFLTLLRVLKYFFLYAAAIRMHPADLHLQAIVKGLNCSDLKSITVLELRPHNPQAVPSQRLSISGRHATP